MRAKGIPYVNNSGYYWVNGISPATRHVVTKPATMDILLGALEDLLPRRPRVP
jgi:hypothetical protein